MISKYELWRKAGSKNEHITRKDLDIPENNSGVQSFYEGYVGKQTRRIKHGSEIQ